MTTPSKKMSLLGLTTLVTINMMGSGIIMLPASMAQLGAISLLSWLITAVGSMAIAYGFAQCGVFCTRAGGMSAYSEEAHGKSGFFLCSFLYFLSLIIANVAIAISAVGYLSAFIPWLASGPVPLFIGSLALIWLTTAANFGGPRLTGRIGVVTVWGVIIPVVGLCVIGWFYFKVEVFVAAWNPHQLQGWDAISASIPLTLWAFLGMESAAQGHDAVEDPQRTVPLACLLGTLGAALVYVLSTTVIQGIVPNAKLASASAPFAVVYAQMFAPWVGEVIMALAVVACIGSLLGWQFTLAQTAKMSADQRMFPRFFQSDHPSQRATPGPVGLRRAAKPDRLVDHFAHRLSAVQQIGQPGGGDQPGALRHRPHRANGDDAQGPRPSSAASTQYAGGAGGCGVFAVCDLRLRRRGGVWRDAGAGVRLRAVRFSG